ncbi:MAG: FAD-dependent oxidoreductase, partial [Candidatus Omnitrophica bacterium]|nr:FAD-dependent oxidoreductase [Candidatus Omnitrophota bacterium]
MIRKRSSTPWVWPKNMYDLIIIGAGPAGITAGIYAARKKMNTLVITGDIGGQAAWSGDIENYTGYQFITGPDLIAKFEEHIRKYNTSLKENEFATGLRKAGSVITVATAKGEYEARSVIIASGKKSRELNVPGEKEYKNKGLTYCATCDAPLFARKNVAVVGGGNSALDAVLQLINIAKHTYIINITPELGGETVMCDKVKQNQAVSILNDTQVTAILGDKMVNAIRIKRQGKEEVLAVEGVFVEVGLIPNSDFAQGI